MIITRYRPIAYVICYLLDRNLVNAGITGPNFPKFTKFSHDVPILRLKLVVMETSSKRLEKEGQISNLQANTHHFGA